MKRFKDDNSTKIVTAQLGWLRRWINDLRTLKTPASLGESEITDLGVKAPKIPNLVDDWDNVNKIMKGKPQADEIEGWKKAGLFGGTGLVLWIGEALGKLPIGKMTGLNYLAMNLAISQGISAFVLAAKPLVRAQFMKAGGGIYDKIKNIFETKYTLKKYKIEKIPATSFKQAKIQYNPVPDESLTLDQITKLLIKAKDNLKLYDSHFEYGDFLLHFRNQSDVDEINHMLLQLIKDDKSDEKLTKSLAPLGVVAVFSAAVLYKNLSDYRSQNPTTKNIQYDPLGQPKSIILSTPADRKKAKEDLNQMLGIPGNKSNTGFKGKNR